MKKMLVLAVLFFVILLLAGSETIAQCAMCKATATSNLEGGGNIARGINTGILYLMAVPYLIIMIIFRKQLAGVLKMLLAKVSSK
jgi:hypothetical protein